MCSSFSYSVQYIRSIAIARVWSRTPTEKSTWLQLRPSLRAGRWNNWGVVSSLRRYVVPSSAVSYRQRGLPSLPCNEKHRPFPQDTVAGKWMWPLTSTSFPLCTFLACCLMNHSEKVYSWDWLSLWDPSLQELTRAPTDLVYKLLLFCEVFICSFYVHTIVFPVITIKANKCTQIYLCYNNISLTTASYT